MITDNNLFYLMCLTFEIHSKLKPNEPTFHITTSNMALMLGMINKAYLDFSSAVDPERREEFALKLEEEVIKTDTRHIPEFTPYKQKIKQDKQRQLSEKIENGTEGIINKQEAEIIAKEYIDNNYQSFEPLTDTEIALRDFYTHVSANLSYKIISCLNTLHKLGIIFYESVVMGLKKDDNNRTVLYYLDPAQKKGVLELRNEVARTMGYDGYYKVVAYKRFTEFNIKFKTRLKEEFGYYDIRTFNQITYDLNVLKACESVYKQYFTINNINFNKLIDENSKEFREKSLENKRIRDNKNNSKKNFQYYLFKLIANQLLIPDEDCLKTCGFFLSAVDDVLDTQYIQIPQKIYKTINRDYNIVYPKILKTETNFLNEEEVNILAENHALEFNEYKEDF